MMSVDIIIPIYNAFDDLQICLRSIYKNTDLQKNRLILINDKSPDERIRPYLDEQIGHISDKTGLQDNIIVIHNETNKGFSNNINLGMEQSAQNDVILLNSDTIVTRNWVEKMVACAYSDGSIGTVTPVSNNATLCSVPNFCEENTLPEGMTVERAAEIVEECSMKKYPRITVAHGFCMLVKREVIDCIGKFDAETFGRGYGEENDFCNRAEQMGYIHVMCDDTYIYHSGTKSFVSKEKEAYIREHDRILQERYPAQMHNNAVHCRDNPNAFVGNNIGYHFDIWNGKKNVLYLLQSDFKEGADDNVGGTQLHVKHLTMGLRNEMNIFVAARDRDYLQVTAYAGAKEHTFRFFIGEKEPFPVFRNRDLAEIFHMILEGFHIDLVHVHHTATTSLDIYYEAEKLGIPVIYTAHDFYYVCPTVKMLNEEGKVCIDSDNPTCEKCLQKKQGLYERNNYIQHWRKEHGTVLDLCKAIIVPSESTREILSRYFPEQSSKIQVIEHGMDKPELINVDESKVVYTNDFEWKIEKLDKKARCPFISGVAYLKEEPDVQRKVILKLTDSKGKTIFMPTNFGRNLDVLQTENRFYCYLPNSVLADGDVKVEAILERENIPYMKRGAKEILKSVAFQHKAKFKVAFIGGINEEKGGKIIIDVIKQEPDDVEWYVMGGIGEESLFQLRRDNLIKTGFYYQEDLATLLRYHGIDAVCILSKWPETFSYTLSEAMINQLPIIVTDIGALGQRTKKSGVGVAVNMDDPVREVVQVVNKWKTKDDAYTNIQEAVKMHQHDTIEQMIAAYREFYQSESMENKQQNAKPVKADIQKIYYAYRSSSNASQGAPELMRRISELENRLKVIDNSVTFKIVQKLTSIRIPYKQKIREMLVKQK